MSIGGIFPNDTSPTMVYVQVIYVHWWYINLLICMFIISETMFIKLWDNGKITCIQRWNNNEWNIFNNVNLKIKYHDLSSYFAAPAITSVDLAFQQHEKRSPAAK